MNMLRTITAAAVMVVVLAPAATAGPGGTDRPLAGHAEGFARYGADGGGTDGLENVLACNEAAGTEFEDFFKVTTFTAGEGIVTHLGRIHFESVHCPGFLGPVGGQLAIVAANGDVLYGEYEGMGEDGILVTFQPERQGRDWCALQGDVACESTGRFAGASGTAWWHADAMQGDATDPFVPWPWWGSWEGTLSY